MKGVVRDKETRQPVPEGLLIFTDQHREFSAVSGDDGTFRIHLPVGKYTLMVSHLGFTPMVLPNIQVSTGKEAYLEIGLEARVFLTDEVTVTAGKQSWLTPSGGSSVRTLQSQDASRYAGGYSDPLRMVANFAGITSGNNDASNEIVVRGNSPRGMLWRIEGMEIPNPNHLPGGVGSNGGAYSMISTNVLADFDFYSGAFPAEYGNALSGVMDLRLRKGSSEKHEFGLQLSVVGAEATAEGPVGKGKHGSFLANVRYANFDILRKYGIINLQDLSIVPSSLDWSFRYDYHDQKWGEFELFSMGGNSRTGNEASSNRSDILKGANNDEFIEKDGLSVFGLKHLINFKNGKSYLRTILGVSLFQEKWNEGIVDTSFVHVVNKEDRISSPVWNLSVMFNNKVNAGNSYKIGFEFNPSFADMFSIRKQTTAKYDTLVDEKAGSYSAGAYFQWKYKPDDILELVPALHLGYHSINGEWTLEPRLGLVFNIPGHQSVNIGTGFYSRMEPIPIYYFRVKTGKSERRLLNRDLRSTKAFHLVAGYRKSLANDWKISLEGYYQYLFDVPISAYTNNTFSMVNQSDGLPDIDLNNEGISENKGLELTVDKSFLKNYYFLATFSLFESGYRASNTQWYATYYNANSVCNLLVGREFKVGRAGQNIMGFNLRNITRGGYRFTPPDEAQSIKKKTLVYDLNQVYGAHLPWYDRLDAGINYKVNRAHSALNVSLDIQNLLNRHNVYRRNFSYANGKISYTDKKLIGLVPIAGIRWDF
ncbi:MAG: TonB-dependent receptor [Marinilabiliales bacterium]|nr:TonB-dependent receptor [Marinilabiliales bacterium]